MSRWAVLGRDDPAPGDPAGTRALGARLLREAGRIDDTVGRLRALASTEGGLRMEGDYAPQFREALTDLPGELGKLGRAYRGCGDSLAAFATSLEEAKGRAGAALRQGTDADLRYRSAVREVRALVPPDRQVAFSNGLGLRPASVEAATAGLDENVRVQVRAAARRAVVADEDLDRARRLADQAAALRGDAESRCVKGIDTALEDSGIKNKSWWEKAWDTVSEPFRSWDEFVKLAGTIALVAGVAAMFLTGPVGWALMATAVLAGAAVFADDLGKFARGEIGPGGLALSALGLIPGARGVVSVAKLGRGVAGLARTVTAGGGRTLVTGLRTTGTGIRNLATAFPHALGVTRALRGGALKDPRLFARAFTCRFTGRDPIDMATGEMVMQLVDFELPGLLPLTMQRTYVSSYGVGRWFGPSWSSPLDQRLEVDEHGVCFACTEAVVVAYPHVAPGETALPAEGPRLALTRTADGGYAVHDPATERTMTFAPPGPPGAPGQVPGAAPGVVLPLAGIHDRNGNRMDLFYDADDGSLAQIRHWGGYVVDVDTDRGRITAFRLRGPGGRDTTLVRYAYDEAGHLTEVINSSGLPLRFTYDGHGRMTSWHDRNGSWYRYTYDAQGRVVRTSGSARCLDGEMRYDAGNRVTVEVNSLGHATSYYFNDAWQIERVVDPLGHATTHEWDRRDHKLAETDPLGRTTRYAYDDTGAVVEITRPDGRRTAIERDGTGRPVRIVEPDGATWRREYDGRGNLSAVVDPAGAATRYGYDALGRLRAVTDPLGRTTRVETDTAGLPVAVTDPAGAVVRIERDPNGRVAAVTDQVGNTTRYEWTVEGRLAARIQPDGATETWRHDGEGNVVEHVDALGQATRTDITYFDLPAVVTRPDGTQLAYSYDTELRRTSVTDGRGLVWRYDYDAAGRLVRETDYDGRVLTYRYDAAGQLVARADGAGQVTTFTHDGLGNVVRRVAGDAVTTMAYDVAGRLLRATNPDADVEFERDRLGRVLAETVNGRTVSSFYDETGRRVARRTPSGLESRWEYDATGRPRALLSGGRRVGFAHDAAAREVERRLGPGVALHQEWDAASRLATQAIQVGAAGPAGPAKAAGSAGPAAGVAVQERTFRYRADGYVTRVEDRLSGHRAFDLDALGQVTGVTGPGWSERYGYDAAGNVVAAAWPAAPALPAAAAGSREFTGTRVRRAGNVRYEYDPDGRVTVRQHKSPSGGARAWHYDWNGEGRLVGVTTPDGQRWRYRYDAFGRRIAKQRLGHRAAGGDADLAAGGGDVAAAGGGAVVEQVDFAWDGVVLAEQTVTRPGSEGGATATTWDWEPGTVRPLTQHERVLPGRTAAGAPREWADRRFHAIVTDLVGTPTELVDESGAVVPQGRAPLWGGAGSEAAGPLRFPGQYHDPESGLHYNLNRHYDPATAAYVSPDPLGLDPGPNPRHYVANPLTWVDPLGLAPQDYVRVRPGQQAPGPLFHMSPDELNFVRRLIGPGGRTNLHVFRTPDGIGKGDFVVVDRSDPGRLVGWVAELGAGKGAGHAGHQLRNAAEVTEDLGLRKWEKVFGSTDELLEVMKRGRGAW